MKQPPLAVENLSLVTLEIGDPAFQDAKAYTKQSLCRILLFQGNLHRYAIGNNGFAKYNKWLGMEHF